MKPLSEVAPGLLVIQIPTQAMWKQKVAKEFLRRVLFVNSYEPVETFTMQAAYFLYCTVNYFYKECHTYFESV